MVAIRQPRYTTFFAAFALLANICTHAEAGTHHAPVISPKTQTVPLFSVKEPVLHDPVYRKTHPYAGPSKKYHANQVFPAVSVSPEREVVQILSKPLYDDIGPIIRPYNTEWDSGHKHHNTAWPVSKDFKPVHNYVVATEDVSGYWPKGSELYTQKHWNGYPPALRALGAKHKGKKAKHAPAKRVLVESLELPRGLIPLMEDTSDVFTQQMFPVDAGRFSVASTMTPERADVSWEVLEEDYPEPFMFEPYGDGAKPELPADIYAYCYPFEGYQLLERCATALDIKATGVYVPMMLEIQYKHSKSWYLQLQKLKATTALKLIGIAFGNPNWAFIVQVLEEYPGLFEGVLLEWVDPRACISNMNVPTLEQLEQIRELTTQGILRYFVREQDFDACGYAGLLPSYIKTEPYSSLRDIGERLNASLTQFQDTIRTRLAFPEFIQPVFFCSQGYEGLCYNAVSDKTDLACGGHQRFLFNPYEISSGRLLHMFNETCRGLPPHDLFGVL